MAGMSAPGRGQTEQAGPARRPGPGARGPGPGAQGPGPGPGPGAQQAHGGLVGIPSVIGRPPIQTPGAPHKNRLLPKVKAWMEKAC